MDELYDRPAEPAEETAAETTSPAEALAEHNPGRIRDPLTGGEITV